MRCGAIWNGRDYCSASYRQRGYDPLSILWSQKVDRLQGKLPVCCVLQLPNSFRVSSPTRRRVTSGIPNSDHGKTNAMEDYSLRLDRSRVLWQRRNHP